MALAAIVDSLENVPEAIRGFYKPVEDKFVLDADVESHPQVQGLRGAYRSDHELVTKLKGELGKFKDIDTDRWAKLKDVREEDLELLETLRNGKETQKHTNGASPTFDLEAEIEKRLAPVKTAHRTELEKREALLRAAEAEREQIRADMKRTRIETSLMAACAEAGVLPTAVEDVVYLGQRYFKVNDTGDVVATDVSGVELFGTDGKPMRPREWIMTRGADKAHWFPLSNGGGAGGGRYGGDLKPARKSELRDLKAKVAFISKHGQKAYEELSD